jgi:uncharacterized protein with FMN-binding domain
MRRVMWALLGTVISTSLLVGLKAQALVGPAANNVATGPGPAGAGGPAGTQPGQSANPGPSGSAGPHPTPGTTAKTGPSTKPGGPGSSSSTGSKPPTQTTSNPPAPRTLTGSAFAASGFGNMQVQIVVSGTTITSLTVLQHSNRPGATISTGSGTLHDAAISCSCVPGISVSGATYSTNAWKQSLQSAINQI